MTNRINGILLVVPILLVLISQAVAQNSATLSPFDGRSWGVVLEHPDTKNVIVNKDVTYLRDEKGTLSIDIYSPPNLKIGERRPAIIFLNGIGEQPGQIKVKDWEIYSTWPKLMAAHGFIGISMESDRGRIQENFQSLFNFLRDKGDKYNVNADELGVYAASANVSESSTYLMKEDAFPGIKAAVLYYGGTPPGPYRKNLPVFFVVAEGDVSRSGYNTLWNEVLKNNAPWTVKMGTGLPHAFDAFDDTEISRKVVNETISFWKNQLEELPNPSWPHSIPREALAAQYWRDDAKVILLLKKWTDETPNDVEGLFQYASALKNAKRYEESQIAYKRLLKLEPDHVHALTYLYLILNILDRPKEAQAFLAKAEKTGRIDKFIYLGMANTMYAASKYKEGVRFFEKVIEVDPTGLNLYNLACGYSKLGENDKAFENLNKAVSKGFTSKQQFETDADLKSLKSDSRWKLLLENLK